MGEAVRRRRAAPGHGRPEAGAGSRAGRSHRRFPEGRSRRESAGEIATVLADVPFGTRKMDVEFEDRSTETVSIDGWRRA